MFGCSIKAKSIAFSALVLPILEYVSPVWSPRSKQNTNLLESILHRGARWVCNSHYDPLYHQWTPSSVSCCETLRWKSLSFRRDVSALITAHDIIHDHSCIPQSSLPDHIQNINLFSAVNHQLIVIVIPSLLEFHSCGINCTPQSPISLPNPCLRKIFTHCHGHHSSCNSLLVSVFCNLMFVVTLLCCNV